MISLVKQPRKQERLSIRADLAQKALLAQAAHARQMNVSQFVLQVALNEAARVICEETQITMALEADAWLRQVADEAPALTPHLRPRPAPKPVGDE